MADHVWWMHQKIWSHDGTKFQDPSIPCLACNGSGKVNDRRCPVCHDEPLTYDAFENLSNYVRTINLNVPDQFRQPQLDLSMVRMRDAIARTTIVYPASEWREDDGAVLWWHFPVCEPPLVGHGPGAGECNADGAPTACARAIESGWLTHWSRLPMVWNQAGHPKEIGERVLEA